MVTLMEMAEMTTETADNHLEVEPLGCSTEEWDSEAELSDLEPLLSDSESEDEPVDDPQ